jgi:hypothetical protein
MKKSKFKIFFTDGSMMIVSAFNDTEARILAQAERIKMGMIYQLDSVFVQDGENWIPASYLSYPEN